MTPAIQSDQLPARLPRASAAEYLANQRTFLAWIRTSIALISFGFVTGKLNLMLPLLAARADSNVPAMPSVHRFSVGLWMMAFGGLLPIMAAWRYYVVNRAIERGAVKSERGTVAFVALLVVLLALVIIIYTITKPEMM